MTSRSIQGQLAAATRHRPTADHSNLKRDLKAAQLEEYIAATVASWPPLSDAQRDRLATLLRGGEVA